MVQSGEEEPILFMVTASVLSVFPNSNSKSIEAIDDGAAPISIIGEGSINLDEELQLGVAKAPAGELIQLKEERLLAQID